MSLVKGSEYGCVCLESFGESMTEMKYSPTAKTHQDNPTGDSWKTDNRMNNDNAHESGQRIMEVYSEGLLLY